MQQLDVSEDDPISSKAAALKLLSQHCCVQAEADEAAVRVASLTAAGDAATPEQLQRWQQLQATWSRALVFLRALVVKQQQQELLQQLQEMQHQEEEEPQQQEQREMKRLKQQQKRARKRARQQEEQQQQQKKARQTPKKQQWKQQKKGRWHKKQ